ncbi:hypothetical protein EKK58_01130 [Candidatus Dependentiae bacterium]|nr:MAG: hypothetical protein EKK58_01130 [Candidatus Dependentiae bacterium]
MPIPLKTISTAIRKFAHIQKEATGVTIEVEPENFWSGPNQEWHLVPKFGNINDINSLALVCETCQWYLPGRMMSAACQQSPFIQSLGQDRNGFVQVNKEHTSILQSPIKYFYDTCGHFSKAGFGIVIPVLITVAPREITSHGKTFRVMTGQALVTHGDGFVRDASVKSDMYFAVSTDSPLYNYMDRGHIVFFVSKSGEDPSIFVANQLSLNVYYFAALYAIAADRLKPLLRNEVFLPAQVSADLQRILLAAEREVPEKYAQAYAQLKQTIRADFDTNAQNVIVTKFQRGEIREVTLNNIKMSENRAVYETISIETPGLTDVILHKLDPNGVFDIYQLVDAFIASILEEAARVPLNASGQGFAEAKQWTFHINNIPITLSLSTTNTRRRVNGHLINNDELPRVLRRATCYTDAASYNSFLRQIEKASLRVHDAIANGVPIKIWLPARAGYHQDVTMKHPKIQFITEGGKYFLWIDKEKTRRVPLRRFVGLLDKLKKLNSQTNNGYVHDDSGFNYRNTDWCKWKLKRIIREHAVDDKDVPLVTEAELEPLVELLLEARTEAEKKSAQLLASVVKETGAQEINYKGLTAYEITGNSGQRYRVEKEGQFRVWKAGTDQYVCIVDGRGEMGVGYDALVARLLALRNDTFVVDRITTLRDHVREGAQAAQAAAR